MNIWQWILVIYPAISLGIAISNDLKEKDLTKTEKTSKILAHLIWMTGHLFILYKANVLIIL